MSHVAFDRELVTTRDHVVGLAAAGGPGQLAGLLSAGTRTQP